jgi:cytochrome c oxidase assembly protein subunit 15
VLAQGALGGVQYALGVPEVLAALHVLGAGAGDGGRWRRCGPPPPSGAALPGRPADEPVPAERPALTEARPFGR